ncbi:response regulator transcription factor [Longispora sp. K20-0274]|uniref:LuxR C-terminal-related transcriptional regulator n=1 Tax=Longispora sp. K20-0274 TaxID=3088255 RepID=UPI003999F94B
MRLLLVDDARLYAEPLADRLRGEERISTVDTASDPAQAEREIAAGPVDVALVNAAMGLAMVRLLSGTHRIRTVALGVTESEAEVLALVEAGVRGYLPRDGSFADLLTVLDHVGRDELLCPPRIAAALGRRLAALAARLPPAAPSVPLTPRELEVLGLLTEGLSNKDVARVLSIEIRTAKNHVHNILDKLGVNSRGEAAALARHLTGPVSPPLRAA